MLYLSKDRDGGRAIRLAFLASVIVITTGLADTAAVLDMIRDGKTTGEYIQLQETGEFVQKRFTGDFYPFWGIFATD